MSAIENRIEELGHRVPAAPKPVAAYIPAIRTGNLVLTSGQLPMAEGKLLATGCVGDGGLTVAEGADLARTCLLNALASVKGVIGDLDRIVRVVRIVVYVQSKDTFHDQPKVANGASEFAQAVFGEAGAHARSAVGVNALPLDAPVEVELTVEVAD